MLVMLWLQLRLRLRLHLHLHLHLRLGLINGRRTVANEAKDVPARTTESKSAKHRRKRQQA
jgi:hypothetical protein